MDDLVSAAFPSGGLPLQSSFFISPHGDSPFSPSSCFLDFFERSASAPLRELLHVELAAPSIRVVNALLQEEKPFAIFSRENSPACSRLDQIAHLFPSVHLIHDASFDRVFLERHRESGSPHQLQKELRSRFDADLDVLAACYVRGWGQSALARSFRWNSSLETEESADSAFRLITSKSLVPYFPKAEYCPIPLDTAIPMMTREEQRKELGVSSDEFLIAHAPQHLISDRGVFVHEALSALVASGLNVSLLHIEDSAWPLEGAPLCHGEESGRSEKGVRVYRRSVASAAELSSLIHASDVFVGLRVDEYLGIPVGLLHALSHGVPAVISKTAVMEEIPAGLAMRVRPGFSEAQELFECLRELIAGPELRESLSKTSPDFVRKAHSPERISDILLAFFETSLPQLSRLTMERRKAATANRAQLLQTREEKSTANDGLLTPRSANAFFQASKDFAW